MTSSAYFTATSLRLRGLFLLLVLTAAVAPLTADEPEQRGFFGFTPRLGEEGVRVIAVTPGGPAETAGVRPGDLIVLLDGKPPSVTPRGGVTAAFTRFRVGDEVEVAVRREGEIKIFRLLLAPVPPPTREAQERAERIDRKIRAAEVVDEMFETLEEFELSFSKEGRLRFRESQQDEWHLLEPEVAEMLGGVTRQLLEQRKEKILRLRVERAEGEEPWLAVVDP
ncbi:MAG TPA: PDZ domain-containing protein [Thermoanaerobaculia bacterium]|nr:PDZ domain-containing protein [Thermoanaerobaculia bacterium]